MDTQGLEQTDLCFVFLFLIMRAAGTNPLQVPSPPSPVFEGTVGTAPIDFRAITEKVLLNYQTLSKSLEVFIECS